jgi:hypothetical protein
LLPWYKWNREKLVAAFFAEGLDKLLKQSGIQAVAPQEMECSAEECEEWDDCPIGMTEDCIGYGEEPSLPYSQHFSMLTCGHKMCKHSRLVSARVYDGLVLCAGIPCWRTVFEKNIAENKTLLKCPMCMAMGDGLAPSAPEAMIKRLVSPEIYKKYQYFTLKVRLPAALSLC